MKRKNVRPLAVAFSFLCISYVQAIYAEEPAQDPEVMIFMSDPSAQTEPLEAQSIGGYAYWVTVNDLDSYQTWWLDFIDRQSRYEILNLPAEQLDEAYFRLPAGEIPRQISNEYCCDLLTISAADSRTEQEAAFLIYVST